MKDGEVCGWFDRESQLFSDGQEVDMSEDERCITFPNGSWRLTNNKHNDVVLVVDDDPGVLKSVSSLLAEHYTVIACPSAGEAFKYASNGKIMWCFLM